MYTSVHEDTNTLQLCLRLIKHHAKMAYEGLRVQLHVLASALEMEVSGQLHVQPNSSLEK
jgi:hypothetical protein